MQILMLEDDETLGRSVKLALELEGIKVLWAKDLKSAREFLKKELFEVHLLDWSLPDGTGLELSKEILEIGAAARVIFLTARTDEESAIQALRIGALDYVRKPFSIRELAIRIKRAADRKIESEDILNYEGLAFDLNSRQATYRGQSIQLAPRESTILEALIDKPGEPLTREQILERAGVDMEADERAIDSHMSHLRAKLRKIGVEHLQIKSSYGVGYVLRKK
ncbi:MAG: response regulator transcription factor [Bdellovibrionales bacterium]|nr:response regulator transcription factor [Bdellovibrionales bacterium]